MDYAKLLIKLISKRRPHESSKWFTDGAPLWALPRRAAKPLTRFGELSFMYPFLSETTTTLISIFRPPRLCCISCEVRSSQAHRLFGSTRRLQTLFPD